jgi:hypothetical protein
MWKPPPLETPGASTACNRDIFYTLGMDNVLEVWDLISEESI